MSPAGFNKRSRWQWRARLGGEPFDLLVVGGGIVGASVFRDAALRGMRVALLEAGDFASGTSSRSSKLMHGCLRHLKRLEFRLVWEACRERDLHARLNPGLVRREPILLPVYEGCRPSEFSLRAAMVLYDCLSGFRNPRHRFLPPAEVLRLAPGLARGGLTGAFVYHEAVVDDARWTLEVVKDGVRAGGVALSYTPVVGLLKSGGNVVGVVSEDRLARAGRGFEVRARAVVNATGGFADVIRKMDLPDAPPVVRLSKGSHLVFARRDVPLHTSVVFFSPRDGRPLVLSRRRACFLYGTTDAWVDDDPGEPRLGEQDGDYLLGSLRAALPDAGLDAGKVRFAYSGFRALPAATHAGSPSDVQREECIEVSHSGLITLIGGKLTTARRIAVRVLDEVLARGGRRPEWKRSETHRVPVGGSAAAGEAGVAGIRAACRTEMVCTVEDLVERRLDTLSWSIGRRLRFLRHNASLLQLELGLDAEDFEEQYQAYRLRLARLHTAKGGPSSLLPSGGGQQR